MNLPPFDAPTLETMSALLPAFDFKALIAADGSGAVYLCNQRSLDRDVAIKILAPRLSEDPAFKQRFETTARSMAKLNHPNLISVFDSGCVEGMLYFVMEFVPGKSLQHSAQGQLVELKQTIQLVRGITAGLSDAHRHGILHGSLNLANILLNQKAEPKITNFGFSQISGNPPDSIPFPQFIAPEILTSNGGISPHSDIYSLGAILYQLLTGQPHRPDAQPPSTFSHCGPKIDELWKQATASDPGQRFPDASSFLSALDSAASTQTRTPATTTLVSRKNSAATPAARPPASITPAAEPTPPSTAVIGKTKVGTNWKLVRNLFIIAGLLYAISFTWEWRKKVTAQRERENRETLARQAQEKEQALADARERQLAKSKTPETTTIPTPDIPEPVIETESPEDSLARLKNVLAAGKRDELPVGSVTKGESAYFLVSQPMTWTEASLFAQQHGGHLAVPDASADLQWLVANVASSSDIWIGAASSGRNTWTLSNATAWKPAKTPSGTGNFIAADKHGFLRAEDAKTLRPFIIQWHKDGSNPGTLANLLSTTRSTLDHTTPIFPPGTRTFGTRHYLFVPGSLTWREAVDLAKNAGGNLIAAAELSEVINLEEMTNDLTAYDAIWLGAFLKGDHWLWITGEPWKTARWIDSSASAPPDSALIIIPGKGWDSRNLSEPASGCIIEWSNDPKTPGTTAPAPAGNGGDLAALVSKAKDLLTNADAKRSQELAANVRKFTWDLDVFLRGLAKSEQANWAPNVLKLKATIKNNRVPSEIPKSSGINLSDQMAKLAQFHSLKQEKIDLAFAAEAEKIRLAFTKKLADAKSDASSTGQRKLVDSLDQSIQNASNLDLWLQSLGIELQPENPLSSLTPKPSTPAPGSNPLLVE